MHEIKAIIAAAALLAPTMAMGEIKVCNEFKEAIFVAVGWEEGNDTKTQGWWQINTGQCMVVDARSLRSPHYIHAETNWKTEGKREVQQEWGGDKVLAVGPDNFKFSRAHMIDPNDTRAGFKDLSANTTGYKSVTYTIKPDGVHSESRYHDN